MAFNHNVGGHRFTERGGRCLTCNMAWAYYLDNRQPTCPGSAAERSEPMSIDDDATPVRTPLTTSGITPNYDQERRAIGVWMLDGDMQAIRIFVTCEGLWSLDPNQVRDVDTAFQLFDKHRAHVENVASARHARGVDYDGEHEGRPMMILRGDDIETSV
jgi:Protein of unknown function (DUF1488)